jgi:hypothetical protein
MAAKEIVPALGLESFSCPHVECGAIAHQTWFKLYIIRYDKDNRPWLPVEEDIKRFKADKEFSRGALTFFENLMQQKVFFETYDHSVYPNTELINVCASKCYSCERIAERRRCCA